MDYKHYSYQGKAYNLSSAIRYMKKGDIPGMEKFLRQKLRCTPAEAKQIAEEIGEDWYQKKGHKKSHKGTIAIIIILVLLAGGFLGYKYIAQPDEDYYVVEKNPDYTPREIGATYEIEGALDSPEYYKDGKDVNRSARALFDMMENSDAQFFVAARDDVVTATNKKEFDKSLFFPAFKTTADKTAAKFGKATWQLLEGNLESQRGSQIEGYTFEGEDPKEYFDSRDLKIKIEKIRAEKMLFEGWSFAIIYDVVITTKRCDGKSLYPKEGKTKHRKVKVIGDYDGSGAQVEMFNMMIDKK